MRANKLRHLTEKEGERKGTSEREAESWAIFQYTLSVLKICNICNVNYRFFSTGSVSERRSNFVQER